MTHLLETLLWAMLGLATNPFTYILVIVAIYETRVITYALNEHHVVGSNEHALEVIGWVATAFTASLAIIMNGLGVFWPLTVTLALLVMLRGFAMWHRWATHNNTVVYSWVRIAGGFSYGLVVLIAGGMATRI